MYTFLCKICGNSFTSKRSDTKCCSKSCSKKNYSISRKHKIKQYKSQYYNDNKIKLNALNSERYYSKKTKYSSISCAYCNISFLPKRSDEKCCSKKCSVNRWRINNKEYSNSYFKKKYSEDINYRLIQNMRSRINVALKKNIKSKSTKELLGCSIEDLRTYLESKFQNGMSWENYGHSTWHIDHIIPLASFDLSDPEQLAEACHYTNLQPLWARDNIIKSDRISREAE